MASASSMHSRLTCAMARWMSRMSRRFAQHGRTRHGTRTGGPTTLQTERYHPSYTEEQEERIEARGEEHAAAFRSGLEALRAEAGTLSEAEIERRVREFSDALDLDYEAAEVELVSNLVREAKWPWRHPLRAFAWAWRHRRSASLPARLSQLNFRPFAQ